VRWVGRFLPNPPAPFPKTGKGGVTIPVRSYEDSRSTVSNSGGGVAPDRVVTAFWGGCWGLFALLPGVGGPSWAMCMSLFDLFVTLFRRLRWRILRRGRFRTRLRILGGRLPGEMPSFLGDLDLAVAAGRGVPRPGCSRSRVSSLLAAVRFVCVGGARGCRFCVGVGVHGLGFLFAVFFFFFFFVFCLNRDLSD